MGKRKNVTISTGDGLKRAVRVIASLLFLRMLPTSVRRGVGIVALIAFALFSALSMFDMGGRFGLWLSNMLTLLFGKAQYFIPFIFCLFALIFYQRSDDRESPQPLINAISILFFILSFTAFWHLTIPLEQSWNEAREGKGGGLSGYVLAYSLLSSIGFWGGLVALSAIFISSSMILLNTSLNALIGQARTLCGMFSSFFSRFGQARSERITFTHPLDEAVDDVHFSSHQLAQSGTDEESGAASISESRTTRKNNGEMEVRTLPRRKIPIQLSLDLLTQKSSQPTSGDIKAQKMVIQKTLEHFGIPVEMGDVNVGPTVTQYTLKPAEGIKLSSITALHNDLALALAAHPIRIEAPIPGRALVGLEVPNQRVALVTLRHLLESDEFKKRPSFMMIPLGKDVSGAVRLANLAAMPHLLIAGATGSGKTVCINTLIMGLLFQNGPESLRFIMIDPKRVELPCYNDIPHLLTPVITDVKKTINALRWTISEMERRFDTLSRAGKRDIASYNKSASEKMPYIVIVIDELADIMVTAGPEAESLIIRLAQMARAVGIHLILATQRPSVDVITGLIKANITSRIAFSVASQMDSRTILDTSGAEKLIGRGDMLFLSADLSKPVRLQGAYVSDEEIERVVAILKEHGEPTYEEGVTDRRNGGMGVLGNDSNDDELLGEATEIILQARKASASLLQRRLRIGYARAANILDILEARGIIGPADGARPRDVLIGSADDADMRFPAPLDEDEEER